MQRQDHHLLSTLSSHTTSLIKDEQTYYYLHLVVRTLVLRRIDKDSMEYVEDNGVIAKMWLEQASFTTRMSLPKIMAGSEAIYHLLEAEDFKNLSQISNKLITGNVISHLEEWSKKLQGEKRHTDNRHLLEILVAVAPDEPRYHRFLGETLEAINGRGDEEALGHYERAHDLLRDFPQYFANIGRCLLARGEVGRFVEKVRNLDRELYEKLMNDVNLSVYTNALTEMGDDREASKIRRDKIRSGTKDPAFYNDEANFMLNKKEFNQALDIISMAEKNRAFNDHSLSIKATILEKKGDTDTASKIRMDKIRSGSRDPVFYNDEANFMLNKKEFNQALDIISMAEKNRALDDHSLSIKATILEKKGDTFTASKIRMDKIRSGSRDPVFYTDESNFLLDHNCKSEAIEILDLADKIGISNKYTESVRKKADRVM